MTYGLPIQFQFGSTIRCRFTFFTETELKFSSGFFHFQSGSTISSKPVYIVQYRYVTKSRPARQKDKNWKSGLCIDSTDSYDHTRLMVMVSVPVTYSPVGDAQEHPGTDIYQWI
jgi:hypothetical protein